jgi:hypothetical protein
MLGYESLQFAIHHMQELTAIHQSSTRLLIPVFDYYLDSCAYIVHFLYSCQACVWRIGSDDSLLGLLQTVVRLARKSASF